MSVVRDGASLWRPLRVRRFREAFVADLVSDIGTFVQGVGAAWLMVSLGAGPTMVALTQTAASLAFVVFALPAGAIGDIVDRRRLILYSELWMLGVAIVLAAATLGGVMSPWLLLALTFALSAGDAIQLPTWRAILADLVGKGDLPAAAALNGIEFNLARAVGPGLAGVLIANAGVGAAFVANVVSFAAVLLIIARWQRPARPQLAPPETVGGATVAALRYVRHSPRIRLVMLRAGLTMGTASALLALLPGLARSVGNGPIIYGLLLGCFGVGAVLGAIGLPHARARWTLDAIASSAVVVLAMTIAAAGVVRNIPLLVLTMLAGGAAWLLFTSLVGALVQTLVPNWARARVQAVYLLAFQGGLAAGSAVWGIVATHVGLPGTLVIAAASTLATLALRAWGTLPEAAVDTTPWNHWRLPAIPFDTTSSLDSEPVLVTVRYHVPQRHEDAFLRAMAAYGRVRRRDGASRWGVFRDLEHTDTFLETFLVTSWAEHVRQHERFTRGDGDVEARVRRHFDGDPVVEHFVGATVTSARTVSLEG